MKSSAALSLAKNLALFGALAAAVAGYRWHVGTQVAARDTTGGLHKVRPAEAYGKQLIDIRSGKPVHLARDSRHTLFVILSGTECPGCLDESQVWDQLSAKDADLRVIALFVGTTSRDVEEYFKLRKPTYEAYRFANPADEGSLGEEYARPLKVLVDRWDRVRYAAGPTNNAEVQDALPREIEKQIGAKLQSRDPRLAPRM